MTTLFCTCIGIYGSFDFSSSLLFTVCFCFGVAGRHIEGSSPLIYFPHGHNCQGRAIAEVRNQEYRCLPDGWQDMYYLRHHHCLWAFVLDIGVRTSNHQSSPNTVQWDTGVLLASLNASSLFYCCSYHDRCGYVLILLFWWLKIFSVFSFAYYLSVVINFKRLHLFER